MAMTLVEQIRRAPGQPASVRVGVVQSTSPLQVSAQGVVFSDVGVLGSYNPVVGNTVILVGQSPSSGTDPASWLVIGSTDAEPEEPVTLQAGSEAISFVAQVSFTQVVNFAETFDVTPSVSTNINNGTAATGGWGSRAINVSTTQFTLFVFGASSTWTNVDVQWQAQAQTQ